MIGTRALDPLRWPNFALLWSAQLISGFGDRITVVALAYVTWRITGSALSTAVAVVISSLPFALFGLFGGAIADAWGHRRAMVAADVVRVFTIGAIPSTLALGYPLWIVYALVVIAALCSTVFSPARLAIVPDLMPTERLGASNSLVYASALLLRLIDHRDPLPRRLSWSGLVADAVDGLRVLRDTRSCARTRSSRSWPSSRSR